MTENKIILLVEDEAIIAMSEKMTLERYGYAVIIVNSGEKAVETVNNRTDIDIILMDINLGKGINGTEAAELILENRDLPLIFLSSHIEREVVEKTEGITSYGYIVKDSGETVLIASIKMAFRLFEAKLKEKEKENALRENEEWLRLAYNAADLGIWKNDINTRRVYLDERARCHYGLHMDEIMLSDVLAIIHPSDVERVKLEFNNVTAPGSDGKYMTEYRVIHQNGDIRWLLVHVRIHFDGEGEARRAVTGFGTTQDITDFKRTQEELAHSHDLLQYIIEHSRSAIAVHDRDLKYVYVSKRYLEEYRVKEKDVIGKHHYDVFPDLPQKWRDVHQRSLKGEVISAEDDPYYRDDGSVDWTRWECRPWYEKNGAIGGIIIYTEVINKRKQTEEELFKKELYLSTLLQTTVDGYCHVNSEGKIIDVNNAYCIMTGYTKEELKTLYINDMDINENQEKTRERIKRIMKNGSEIFETRQRKKDGTIFEVEISVTFLDLDGGLMICICRDITDRKRTEEALRVSEKKYHTLFVTMAQGVVYQNANGYINSANPAAEEILGITLNQMQSMSSMSPEWNAIHEDGSDFSGDTHPSMIALQTGREVRNTIMGIYHPKLKERRWININAVPQFNTGENKPFQVYTTFEDITDRKLVEEKIKNQLHEKELLLKEVHHRIKNNIASVEHLLTLQLRSNANIDALTILQKAISRVQSMRIIYEKLLLNTDYRNTSGKEYLNDLIDAIVTIFSENEKIKLKKSIDDFNISAKLLFPIGSIINELITNAMKYAFVGKDSGLIEIDLKNNSNHITLTIQDNGNGLPHSFHMSESNGFGLKLVEMFSKQLGGDFTLENHNGVRSILNFNI